MNKKRSANKGTRIPDITSQTNGQPQAGLSREQFKALPDSSGGPSEQSERRIHALLTRRQVAQRWNCCGHTIARMRNLRPVRFNRRLLRYRLEDIQAIETAAGV